MKRFFLTALIAAALIACSTTPDTANDPRSGGFFGAVAGVTRGDYDARQKEREDALANIRDSNKGLQRENASLAATRQAKQEQVARTKRQVAKLDQDVRSLSGKVSSLRKRTGNADVAQLDRRVGDLDRKTASLKGKADGGDAAALATEKGQLEKEYSALLQTYLTLSDAGGSTASKPASGGLRDLPKPD